MGIYLNQFTRKNDGGRKRRYWESCKTNKTLIWDLKMSGGIEGEVVNGGAVLGGTTVYVPSKTTILLITDFR